MCVLTIFINLTSYALLAITLALLVPTTHPQVASHVTQLPAALLKPLPMSVPVTLDMSIWEC